MAVDTAAVSIEAARLEWRAALDRQDDHRQQCDAYICNLPCGGCALFLSIEQAAHGRYVAARQDGGVL